MGIFWRSQNLPQPFTAGTWKVWWWRRLILTWLRSWLNAIQKLVFTAGQKLHADLYGATLTIYGKAIPCTSSKPRKGWVLANGKSPDTFVQSIKFFRSDVDPQLVDKTEKGVDVILKMTPDSPPLNLRLDAGGLMIDGMTFDFEAMDLNQHA
jgi:hypothetical protein